MRPSELAFVDELIGRSTELADFYLSIRGAGFTAEQSIASGTKAGPDAEWIWNQQMNLRGTYEAALQGMSMPYDHSFLRIRQTRCRHYSQISTVRSYKEVPLHVWRPFPPRIWPLPDIK